ncbi:MAG: hypothetical protein O7A63_10455, partial [Acidobacteria bacterium]|nr:hypothetical protein [Acidobacteriota bacterium]
MGIHSPQCEPRLRIIVVLTGLSLALSTASFGLATDEKAGEESPPHDLAVYEEMFDAFYRTGLDTSRAFAVRNLTLSKDNMQLVLEQGTVFLAKPIGEEITGAVFLGRGRAKMSPPNHTERYMLKKYSGSESLDEAFTEAVFRFSDGTARSILASPASDPGDAALSERASALYRKRNHLLDRTRALQLEMQLLQNRISSLKGRDFFLAELNTTNHDWLTYMFNPAFQIEHGIYATEASGSKSRRIFYPWTDWHHSSDYGPKGHYLKHPDKDQNLTFRIKHHEMLINLPDTRSVRWERKVVIEPQLNNLTVLLFDLGNNADFGALWTSTSRAIRIDAVTDESGNSLSHLHRKDQLLVLLDQPLMAGVPAVLEFKGESEVVYQLTAQSYGLIQNAWYPQSGFLGGRSTFHWTVRVPQPLLASGSGEFIKIFEDDEAKQNVLEMKCDTPSHFPWVIFGRFQSAASVYNGEETSSRVPMTIHSFPYMSFTITDPEVLERIGSSTPFPVTLTAPRRKVDAIFEEGKEILKLYENLYGPYPYDELHIAQMAPFLGFGQAPQGFVQLTGEAFMSQSRLESDFFHGFLAHEFAHQWWAHQIGWASGDDEWLSESFAE